MIEVAGPVSLMYGRTLPLPVVRPDETASLSIPEEWTMN